ncbi:MAG: C40 family peptidase [Selenomonas sp.]|uniref:NlpC/P60 family protein n=1 Tax=Selenomonas sp. TaxID=2053611 RepID=UPI0025DC25A0|nr:NlpC/P60 family protein [Selenomonas sp.]MCI6100268.1 C40 family peptidase [Selenomonas sp.]MCI6232473.1 C40 family peptidase [Selenomonas sp.]
MTVHFHKVEKVGAAIGMVFAIAVCSAGSFCGIQMPQVAAHAEAASPAVTDERAEASYWTERNPDGERVLFSQAEIAAFNDAMRERTETLKDLASEPVTAEVRYGVATRRGNLRLAPVPPDGSRYDEQQATAVDPCESLLVYEDSDDGRFSHVVMRNYEGWLSKRAFALTDRTTWMQFAAPKDFAVVTANRWKLYDESSGKTATYQMGAKIPLVRAPLRGYRGKAGGEPLLLVPSRAPDGTLVLHMQPAVFDDDLHHGFLPCTENNFVRQGFRFLGDVYGWGGLDNSVDCSAFTSDVYRSMGLEIPRDADVQGQALPYRAELHGGTDARLALLTIAFPIGTLLSNDTHVMMYIGQDADGTPMALQAMSSYFDETGKHYPRQVVLTTLTYPNSAGNPYIDGVKYLSAIK